jgi:hypothetical protein
MLEQVQKAPKELFSSHGIGAEQVLQAAMEEATQDPVKLLERKYAALEAKLAQESQERARIERSLQEREQQATMQARQAEAIKAATDAERFPALSARYADNHPALLSEMAKVANEYHERVGQWPTYEDVAEFLDEREQSIFAKYTQGGARVARPGPASSKPARIGTSLSAVDATGTTGAPESKAISHEERLRRARASEAMTLRNATRGR